jgi:eukaryotic-like serine/threonine-protein kinase
MMLHRNWVVATRNWVLATIVVVVTGVEVSPGLLLGRRYRLDGRIAAGGMGEVWRATDLVLARPVAVKLLRYGYAGEGVELARFRAEARHAGSLSHPGIAQVYDYHEAEPPVPPYLVMELVDGPSLATLLAKGPLDPARTMDVIAQAARALQAAHMAGLVHRDIKPGNVLVSRSGQVKVTDFGIAHAAGAAPLTRPGALIGTPAYLAPEQIAGAHATPAADLYALGIVAFRCLTGRLPFDGPPLAVAMAQQDKPLPPLPPSVPAEVAALVAELTAKDPWARPVGAGEVAQRAEQLRTALTETAARQRGKRKQGGRQVRQSAYAASAAAAVAAIAATGWIMTGVHGPMAVRSQPGPPTVSQPHSPGGSHPAGRVRRIRETRVAAATGAPAQGRRSAADRSPTENVVATETPTPAGPRTGAVLTPVGIPAGGPPTLTATRTGGTPVPTASPTGGTPTQTASSTGTPTPTASPTGTATPTLTGSPPPTATPAGDTPTSTPAGSPAPTATTPTGAPVASGTPTPTPTEAPATGTPSQTGSQTSGTPTAAGTPKTRTPGPTLIPANETPSPSGTPTSMPSSGRPTPGGSQD